MKIQLLTRSVHRARTVSSLDATSRMSAPPQQERAQASSILVVHVQELDSRAPLRCKPVDDCIRFRDEVLSPRVPPGMIELYDKLGLGVNRRDILPLLQVAANAA
ncbi:hypothetical protein [Sorangium cellulosum]|uniref:hypothetical protein n=1 Tax=Sorangium cellulosum TaxID=56 RepID=UPI001F2A94EB|nr:hypothetical protein [Sorangium cellulosum]